MLRSNPQVRQLEHDLGTARADLRARDRELQHLNEQVQLSRARHTHHNVGLSSRLEHARRNVSRSTFHALGLRVGGTDPHRDPQLLRSDRSAFVFRG